MRKTVVLIPCYNEAKTISKVVKDFKAVLPEAEIIVYDNNSRDGTAQIAMAAGARVCYERRQGKGNVLRSMFRDIEADCYILVDGDDTYPAENAKEMETLVLDGGYDMVIGDRLSSTYFQENKRPFHNSGNVLVRTLVNTLFADSAKNEIKDIMTGYRAFSRAFVKSFPVLSKGFEIETEMSIHALDNNFSMTSIPVQYRDRPEGSESKLNTFKDGMRVLKTIGTLFKDYKPLAFFGILALCLMLIAVCFLVPVLVEFAETGLVRRFPTFIAACFFALFSLQSFSCGLILDTQIKKAKQSFEIQMNILKELENAGKRGKAEK